MTSPLWEGVREGCGSCAFAHPNTPWKMTDGSTHQSYECRRYPPQMVQHVERGSYSNELQYEIVPSRPTMVAHEWCGEWKRKGLA